MIKRVIPFVVKVVDKRVAPFFIHLANQNEGSSSLNDTTADETQPGTSTISDYANMNETDQETPSHNSCFAWWIPELNPVLWLIINVCICLAYAVPLIVLLAASDSRHYFFFSPAFYLGINIVSCIMWVLQAGLSAWWFWNKLGLVRAVELVLSLYFVLDAFWVIYHRNLEEMATSSIAIDYGIGCFAYVWAVELSIKGFLKQRTSNNSNEAGTKDTGMQFSNDETVIV